MHNCRIASRFSSPRLSIPSSFCFTNFSTSLTLFSNFLTFFLNPKISDSLSSSCFDTVSRSIYCMYYYTSGWIKKNLAPGVIVCWPRPWSRWLLLPTWLALLPAYTCGFPYKILNTVFNLPYWWAERRFRM